MKTKILTLSVLCFLSLVGLPAFAQEPTPAEPAPFQMPDMSKLYSQMMTGMFEESLKPERAVQLAHFQKLHYDALVKEGFTKPEALELVKASAGSAGVGK